MKNVKINKKAQTVTITFEINELRKVYRGLGDRADKYYWRYVNSLNEDRRAIAKVHLEMSNGYEELATEIRELITVVSNKVED